MKLSRGQLADYILNSDGKDAVKQVAGYLVANGRSKEVDLVIREVETKLNSKGRTVARVQSTRELGADEQKQVIKMLKSQDADIKSIEIINEIDPSLLGGVVVRTPRTEVDLSIRGRLNRMQKA